MFSTLSKMTIFGFFSLVTSVLKVVQFSLNTKEFKYSSPPLSLQIPNLCTIALALQNFISFCTTGLT